LPSIANRAPTVSSKIQSDFIFSDSDNRLLTSDDLRGLSKDDLRIARNEIFARRGRYFSSPDLTARFSKFSWYVPNTWNPELNTIERANVALIERTEPADGSQGDFLIPDSDRRILTLSDLRKLSKEDLRIARNEIFARRGRYFEAPDLKSRFERFSWYSPNTWNPKLNSIEQANVALMDQVEKR
jgi:type IV secretory pathway TraG/TraD family ATPase VirD4